MNKVKNPLPLALLMGSAAGFTLAGYELIRSPANSLFAERIGKGSLPLVTALIPVMVALVAVGYGRTLTMMGPKKTLFWTTCISSLFLGVLGWLSEIGVHSVLWPLYLFKEAYVVLLIEQYWSYINSALDEKSGSRYNGLICGIASIGSVLGGVFGASLANEVGSSLLVCAGSVIMLPALFLTGYAFNHFFLPVAPAGRVGWTKDLGASAFRSEKILFLILALVCVSQAVGTLLGLTFQGVLSDYYPNADEQSKYSYQFYAWVNGVAGGLQFIGAPLLLRALSPMAVLILIPLIHFGAVGYALINPSVGTWAIAFAGFKCIDYSIFRAAKEVLYIPLSFDARYRAKELIDMFGYRFSKGATSGIVSGLQSAFGVFSEFTYGMASSIGALIWLTITTTFYFRVHRRKS